MNSKTWLCCTTEFSDIDKFKWSFNMPCKSLKGILVLFEEEEKKSYTQDMNNFFYPKMQKVSVLVEGKPNQPYSQGMRSFEQYDKICKYLLKESKRTTMLMRFKNNCNYMI